jgi:hypothetical protein
MGVLTLSSGDALKFQFQMTTRKFMLTPLSHAQNDGVALRASLNGAGPEQDQDQDQFLDGEAVPAMH